MRWLTVLSTRDTGTPGDLGQLSRRRFRRVIPIRGTRGIFSTKVTRRERSRLTTDIGLQRTIERGGRPARLAAQRVGGSGLFDEAEILGDEVGELVFDAGVDLRDRLAVVCVLVVSRERVLELVEGHSRLRLTRCTHDWDGRLLGYHASNRREWPIYAFGNARDPGNRPAHKTHDTVARAS